MTPTIRDGKVFVPIIPSELQDGTMIDGMVPLSEAETVERLSSAWAEINRLRERAAVLESLLHEGLRAAATIETAFPRDGLRKSVKQLSDRCRPTQERSRPVKGKARHFSEGHDSGRLIRIDPGPS